MRKILIDTDTGSDDAIAILMALREPTVEVVAVTTVCGNVSMEQATINAFRAIEAAGTYAPPVYKGAYRPLFRDLVTAENVHGEDGMGDMGLAVPDCVPEKEHAVEAILRIVGENPDEIEIVALGPATNIALAMMKDPETMKKVKHIYSMGSGGFGPGNVTSVAEFNVYVDAESYKVMVDFPVPVTLIGFDTCAKPDAIITVEEMEEIKNDGPVGKFAMDCNATLVHYCLRIWGLNGIDLPDPCAMGAALWPDTVLEAPLCACYVCTANDAAYGQVVVDNKQFDAVNEEKMQHGKLNAAVVKTMDLKLFKKRLRDVMRTV